MTSGSRAPHRWRERLSGTPRLVLAVVLLAAGVLVALTATAPPALGPVLVAAHPVAAGAVVAAADVAVTRRPTADLPDGALTSSAPALGRRVVGLLARGEVVTRTRLAPDGFAAAAAAGRAVTAVTVAAGQAAVAAVGDTVRLVVAGGGADPGLDLSPDPAPGPVTVADDAVVLAVWPAGGADDTTTLAVDVDVGSASRLAVLPAAVVVGLVIVTA